MIPILLKHCMSDDNQALMVIDSKENQYTHLRSVRVFARKEDADVCERVEVNCYTGEVNKETICSSKCPSDRRHSVVLVFNSECGDDFALCLDQHKGTTYVKRIDIPGFLS